MESYWDQAGYLPLARYVVFFDTDEWEGDFVFVEATTNEAAMAAVRTNTRFPWRAEPAEYRQRPAIQTQVTRLQMEVAG